MGADTSESVRTCVYCAILYTYPAVDVDDPVVIVSVLEEESVRFSRMPRASVTEIHLCQNRIHQLQLHCNQSLPVLVRRDTNDVVLVAYGNRSAQPT